ncbi:MAG: SpoIIE family protein phosphatase [Ignavibacteriales bacterium]|nr:MAG: SpoIIE family protein phosphatase [Ignavibacteriaceae bacterium]MBW7873783.1 SpoIIE family protein phosphatase [Ignavibacteria bacterium]MCZ2144120.1 SpoIIE family protein phosphatase [Ignavibacteriales bacterium]OQY73048.1 MAG: hypothetical protein B6D45_08470 [Ignavibacteriales bacterium UTCHB3]MBV6445760.1 Phosphoserine phosphatase RsbP [Ignavibacteriaceae bacterium]
MDILIADDLAETRILLKSVIKKLGHNVYSAEDGAQAWELLQENPNISLLISDWEMPNMTGIELCRKIRSSDIGRYLFIILLTAKNQKDELIEGMAAGADDFITKPFNNQELDVRIRAGERIIRLQEDLAQKNKKLSDYNERLEKDLRSAAKLQESLLPKRHLELGELSFDSIFIPSLFVAGDIFNYFKLDEDNTGFYLLDVSGHGVSSAMLSFTLSKYLNAEGGSARGVLRKWTPSESNFINTSPEIVLGMLNRIFEMGEETMQYFTMVYGKYNYQARELEVSLGGHPPVLVMRANGGAEVIDLASIPIGMFRNSEYSKATLRMEPGDRILVYSDGLCDCFDTGDGKVTENMTDWFRERNYPDVNALSDEIKAKMRNYMENNPDADDISLIIISVN